MSRWVSSGANLTPEIRKTIANVLREWANRMEAGEMVPDVEVSIDQHHVFHYPQAGGKPDHIKKVGETVTFKCTFGRKGE